MTNDHHPIRIVVADDHAIMREGLVIILNNQPDMKVVAECGDGEEAVSLVLEHRPDVAILDLQMPKSTGVAATVAILKKVPDARILFLTTYDGDEDIFRGMKVGARGYLLKESRKDEVLHAIREVAAGRRYLSPAAGASFANSASLPQLTKREREILILVSAGKANKEIAAELNISEGTVKGHVNGIMQKMNVASRTEAALLAERRGLLRD
jgi:two-component system NarL family response regulator